MKEAGLAMSYMKGLKCRECGREYPKEALYVCEYCFGPLEVAYDYDGMRGVLTRDSIASRPQNLWRYRELLPLDGKPTDGLNTGFTPLLRADNLARALGVESLYVKNDAVNHPTLSFKDRVVAVAVSRAKELGFDTIACASTGNLANSVAAQVALAGMKAFIFIPSDLELGKVVGTLVYGPTVIAVEGNYDQVNRLCSEVGTKYPWAFVNINIRPYYAEGSKTYAFEIAEQLGWKAPGHIVVPCAGGSLITKVSKGLKELEKLGIIDDVSTRIYAAQPSGCAPIITAVHEDSDIIRPVKPCTIAKSLAIGNPADGVYAAGVVKESGGWAEAVSDREILDSIELLARTEGIFTETAGGVTLGVTRKLIEQGRIPRDESIVVCITGNGLKTQEPVAEQVGRPVVIKPDMASFEENFKV